jgi:CubicO group peptidase (beta-lactamase class C family)
MIAELYSHPSISLVHQSIMQIVQQKFAAELQTILDDGVAHGIPGLSAAIATHNGIRWISAAGLANVQTHEPMWPDMLFGIGSITKTLVAVVILQLAEEGRLHLDHTAANVLGMAVEGIGNTDRAGCPVGKMIRHGSVMDAVPRSTSIVCGASWIL